MAQLPFKHLCSHHRIVSRFLLSFSFLFRFLPKKQLRAGFQSKSGRYIFNFCLSLGCPNKFQIEKNSSNLLGHSVYVFRLFKCEIFPRFFSSFSFQASVQQTFPFILSFFYLKASGVFSPLNLGTSRSSRSV